MDDQNVYGDEDTILRDVPISFVTPQKLKVDDSEHKVNGDEDATLTEVPISFITPQESKVDVIEHKVIGDEDVTLIEVPISFITPQESKVDVIETMDKQQKVDRRNAIMAVPISFIAPQVDVLLKQHKNDEAEDGVLMEVPISFIATDESKADALENMDKQHQVNDDEDATLMEVPISFIGFEESNPDVSENAMIPNNTHYLHTHTFEQRRKNWIIKNTSRRDGSTIDHVYHHLETNKKFRSLVEVYKFVVHGDAPETKKKLSEYEETLQVTPKRKPHVRGKKLIKHYVVGTCTEPSNGVYIKNRGEVNYLREIPSNIEKKGKRENEDLYGYQQVNLGDDTPRVNSEDVTLSTPIQSFLYLWDFEPIQQRERPVEMFLIPNIEKSEVKDPLIDLLSSLPKASGKRPYEDDEERNKSEKRKHMKRDQEHEDILEAQRRSRVDEELRLDELRARAGGASSSIVPTQVSLFSGVDVAMESQNLTITPPVTQGTSEVLLSVSATTETAIDIFEAIESPSLLPDSEA